MVIFHLTLRKRSDLFALPLGPLDLRSSPWLSSPEGLVDLETYPIDQLSSKLLAPLQREWLEAPGGQHRDRGAVGETWRHGDTNDKELIRCHKELNYFTSMLYLCYPIFPISTWGHPIPCS